MWRPRDSSIRALLRTVKLTVLYCTLCSTKLIRSAVVLSGYALALGCLRLRLTNVVVVTDDSYSSSYCTLRYMADDGLINEGIADRKPVRSRTRVLTSASTRGLFIHPMADRIGRLIAGSCIGSRP